ncbi:MAG: hypothetical protein ABH808_00265 [Candidatus Kuenenbacteria bacterium]
MTTKTITIQKKGIIVLPREWLQEINQVNKLKACFVNGSIVLSRLENEEEKNYTNNFKKAIQQAEKDYKNGHIYRASSVLKFILPQEKHKMIGADLLNFAKLKIKGGPKDLSEKIDLYLYK